MMKLGPDWSNTFVKNCILSLRSSCSCFNSKYFIFSSLCSSSNLSASSTNGNNQASQQLDQNEFNRLRITGRFRTCYTKQYLAHLWVCPKYCLSLLHPPSALLPTGQFGLSVRFPFVATPFLSPSQMHLKNTKQSFFRQNTRHVFCFIHVCWQHILVAHRYSSRDYRLPID